MRIHNQLLRNSCDLCYSEEKLKKKAISVFAFFWTEHKIAPKITHKIKETLFKRKGLKSVRLLLSENFSHSLSTEFSTDFPLISPWLTFFNLIYVGKFYKCQKPLFCCNTPPNQTWPNKKGAEKIPIQNKRVCHVSFSSDIFWPLFTRYWGYQNILSNNHVIKLQIMCAGEPGVCPGELDCSGKCVTSLISVYATTQCLSVVYAISTQQTQR